jgi:hypothetical protein
MTVKGGAMSWIETIEDNRTVEGLLSSGRMLLALPVVIFGIEVFTAGRILFLVVVTTLGVLRFIQPEFGQSVQAPFPLPGQPWWSYFTGIAFLAAGASIFMNSRVRFGATLLGISILLFGLTVWLLWLAAHPRDVACGNYLKDMGMAGGAFLLAGALPRKDG